MPLPLPQQSGEVKAAVRSAGVAGQEAPMEIEEGELI
jgi:hypothetical protein